MADYRRRGFLRATQRSGGRAKVTVYRRHSLSDPVAGGEQVTTLELDGGASDGATLLDLRPPAGVRLDGMLRAGGLLEIAGVDYTVQADARVSGELVTDVQVAPGLEAAAPDGEPVTVKTGEHKFARMRAREVQRADDGRLIRGSATDLALAAAGSTIEPEQDDAIALDGELEDVLEVVRIGATDRPLGWIVKRGGSA